MQFKVNSQRLKLCLNVALALTSIVYEELEYAQLKTNFSSRPLSIHFYPLGLKLIKRL